MKRSPSEPVITEELICAACGQAWSHRWHAGVSYEDLVGKQHWFRLRPQDRARMTETDLHSLLTRNGKRLLGKYDPRLPGYAERRRIRERAGWSRQQVADELSERLGHEVNRRSVHRWEQPVGRLGKERLPGREPSGDRRRVYAELPTELRRTRPVP